MRVVVAAGGTAGHLSPGIAVAEILRARQNQVLFIGRKGGPEAATVEAKGFHFEGISIRGRGPGVLSARNARAGVQLVLAVARCLRIFSRFRPDVVMGAGGYVSLAPALASRVAGIPLVIHEQNAVPGLANKIAKRFAARVAVSFPGTESFFGPRAVLTGNPVRGEIAGSNKTANRPAALEHFKLSDSKQTVLVFGGSQGAAHLNKVAVAAYDNWRLLEMQVLHLAGRGKAEQLEQRLSALRREDDLLEWHVFEYSDRMDLAYACSDLAVCRAGASTIAELASAGLPAVLVPLPISLDDDQRRNAEAACKSGGARMVLQADLTPESLGGMVVEMLSDAALMSRMSAAIRTLARPDAAAKLADLVLEAAKSR